MTDESGHELQIAYAVYFGEFIRCREKKNEESITAKISVCFFSTNSRDSYIFRVYDSVPMI